MDGYEPQAGDVVACWGRDFASLWISFWTSILFWPFAPRGLRWSPSHVAIIADGFQERPELLWYESTTMCAHHCLFDGRPRSGVQVHRIATRVDDYKQAGGRVEVYRLTPGHRLSRRKRQQLRDFLVEYLENDTQYDMRGALGSGLQIFYRLPVTRLILAAVCRGADLFCSDLVARLQMRLELLKEFRDTDEINPGGLMRLNVREGLYQRHRKL